MKVKKENGKYYVNDLDLQEVLSNRKYVMNYITNEISNLENIRNSKELWKPEYDTKLKVLKDIHKKMQLRK